MAKQKFDYDLIVLGSGGGGSIAAHIAASAGKKVAIIESEALGGECPNYGCIPMGAMLHAASVYDIAKNSQHFGIRSAALSYNYPSIRAWKNTVVEKSAGSVDKTSYERDGIRVLSGEGRFIDPHTIIVSQRHYSADYILIATGSHFTVPAIEGLEEIGFITPKEALDLSRPPKSLFIIGSSSVGCELAELFSIFGTKVYLSDITPRPLVSEDDEVGELIRDVFEAKRGMDVLSNAKVMKVTKEGLSKRVYVQHSSDSFSVKVDEILVATGKMPNIDLDLESAGIEYTPVGIKVDEYLETSVHNIFAAGDVVGSYPLAHAAIYQSRVAVNNILHKQKIAVNYKAMPRCVFITPEIASVGMSEDECIKRDLRVKKALAPLSITAKSGINYFEQGFVKVIANNEHKLLGATIVAPNASEMIHELILAIQHNISAEDIAKTIHVFPTWSEAIRVACSKLVRSTH